MPRTGGWTRWRRSTPIRAAGGLASLAHFAEARRPAAAARPMAEGLERARDAPPLVRRGDLRGAWTARRAASLGLVETGGTDYHGDLGPYAEAHAALVMPDWRPWRGAARPARRRAGPAA